MDRGQVTDQLVAQPEASLRGCFDATHLPMHLPMHKGVLHLERNPRIPITLSQARWPRAAGEPG